MQRLISYVLLLLFSSIGFANPNDTLIQRSIDWNTIKQHQDIFASLPHWSQQTIDIIAAYYHDAKRKVDFPSTTLNRDNVDLINRYFGPTTNPFAKFPRPAKLFVFIGNTQKPTEDNYYIAPIIANASTQMPWVLEKSRKHAIQLNDWMRALIAKYPKNTLIRINICNGYATEPHQSCEAAYYQTEVRYVYKDEDRRLANFVSAKRLPQEDWRSIVKKQSHIDNDSPVDARIPIDDEAAIQQTLLNTPAWNSYDTITQLFKTIRDQRYLGDQEKPNFLRRLSWLMPQDGCWSRAAATIRDFFGPFHSPIAQYRRPAKLFAFGNLCVNTNNDVDGAVRWWYHVAPIIRDANTNETYVLDPAVDPLTPLPVKTWLQRIADNSGMCANTTNSVSSISICDGYSTTPYLSCSKATPTEESYSMLDQLRYQLYERSLQTDLGRDADDVLGEHPPWLSSAS